VGGGGLGISGVRLCNDVVALSPRDHDRNGVEEVYWSHVCGLPGRTGARQRRSKRDVVVLKAQA
jgi:hypothetical protein